MLLLIAICTFLPALLTRRARMAGAVSQVPAHLRGFGCGRLAGWSQRHPGVVLGAIVLVTLALGSQIPRARYNENVVELRAPTNPASQAQQKLMAAFGTRFTPYLIRSRGDDEEQALESAAAVAQGLESLLESGAISRFESIANLMPDRSRQREVLRRIRSFSGESVDFRSGFTAALRDAGLDPSAFASGIDWTARALEQDSPLALGELVDGDLGPLLGRYLHVEGGAGGTSVLSFAYQPPSEGRVVIPPGLLALEEIEGVRVTGPVVVSRELRTVVLEDAGRSALAALVLVAGVLSFTLGGLRAAFMALLPMALGTLWLLGWLGLLGIELNLLNLFVFPMLIGISVDYGVHMQHRLREGESPGAIEATARAIGVAALTTMLGFGSLSLSHFPGLRAMGLVAVFGALSAAIIAVTLGPAVHGLAQRRART